MKNSTLIISVAIALLVGVGIGYLLTHQTADVYNYTTAVVPSSSGATNSTAKIATTVMIPSTASATSSSLYNSDSTDRAITSSMIMCTGVGTSTLPNTGAGIANWLWRMATTSSGTITQNITGANANYAANLTVATTSANLVDGNGLLASFTSSTTEGVIFGVSRLWPTGSYLTIQPNATNTATCTVGVHYISL